MPSPGFLGTGAPLCADITLAIEIAMGLGLALGMVLARRQRYRAHAWCQNTVVVLNLIVIAQVMLPALLQIAKGKRGAESNSWPTMSCGDAVNLVYEPDVPGNITLC